jgi:hypothetical protein
MGSSSALLRCLERLNHDVWADVLLPKLIADQTAGAVAASCSALRRLCHGSVRKLNLTPLGSSSSAAITVQQHLAKLHQHFSDCSTVKMAMVQESSYLIAPAIVEGLSRQVGLWLESVLSHVPLA